MAKFKKNKGASNDLQNLYRNLKVEQHEKEVHYAYYHLYAGSSSIVTPKMNKFYSNP